jgi:Uri superfamily endonuclease
MDRGVYALVFRNRSCSLRIGSLGEIPFRKGWHVYVGSARGPGGFARVSRHRRLALSRDRPPTWHVDRLLLSPLFLLRHVVCGSTEEDLECTLARSLRSGAVPSFGASDCSCGSHLFYRPSDPLGEVMDAMSSLGLASVSATIKKE